MAPVAAALSLGPSTLDNDDSAVSSPLSDVEDADGDDPSLEGMRLDHEPALLEEQERDASDSDSNLSDANDTEAETERLYDTPQAQRRIDVVVKRNSNGGLLDNTPTKLKKTTAGDGLDDDDDSLSEIDGGSTVSSPPADENESPSKTANAADALRTEDTKTSTESKKRKRSLGPELSDPDRPLRKRTGSGTAHGRTRSNEDAMLILEAPGDAASTNSNSVEQSGAEDGANHVAKEKSKTPRGSASPTKASQATRKMTRSGSKQNKNAEDEGASVLEEATAEEETKQLGDEEAVGAEVNVEAGVDGEVEAEGEAEAEAEVEAEDDAEAAAKNAEERKAGTAANLNQNTNPLTQRHLVERKQAALEEWNELEAKFGLFRDRLYKDRLERLEAEEQSLQGDNPTHAEYLLMKQCLDERLETRLRDVKREHELALEAMERVAVARRAQIWGQFYQSVRDKREQYLESLNREWHETQNARRSAHSVPDYGLHFPSNHAERTRNSVSYNLEVSYLSGLAKHEGFPAVPTMKGASSAEMAEDFSAIQRASRSRPRNPAQPLGDYQGVSFGGSLGPAGEQFIKNTPWANPNHISHKMQPVPLQSESGPSAAMPPAQTAAAAAAATSASTNASAAGPTPAPSKATPVRASSTSAHPSRANNQRKSQPPPPAPAPGDASPETLRTAAVLSQGISHTNRAGSLGGPSRGPKGLQGADPASGRDTSMAVAI